MTVRLVLDRDPAAGPSTCADCAAPIVWAVTDRGERMPIDLEPRPGGGWELFAEYFPDGEPVEPGVHRARPRPDERPASSPAWWPHWATCSRRRRPPRRRGAALELLLGQLRALRGRKWGPLFAARTDGGNR